MSIALKVDGQRQKTVYMAKRRQQMDIFESDELKRRFCNTDPIEIPISGISGPLLEQLEQEMALSEEIQEKFKDVCKYMLEHRLHRLSLENELVNFDLTMNRIKKEAADE